VDDWSNISQIDIYIPLKEFMRRANAVVLGHGLESYIFQTELNKADANKSPAMRDNAN